MKEKVLDISEVKPGDEFVYHEQGVMVPHQIYRVITVGEEMVFMGVEEGPYYRETLVHRNEIQNGSYVRYKKPKVEKTKRFLVRDTLGNIRWSKDRPSKSWGMSLIGAIEVTIVDDKIVKVEIADV